MSAINAIHNLLECSLRSPQLGRQAKRTAFADCFNLPERNAKCSVILLNLRSIHLFRGENSLINFEHDFIPTNLFTSFSLSVPSRCTSSCVCFFLLLVKFNFVFSPLFRFSFLIIYCAIPSGVATAALFACASQTILFIFVCDNKYERIWRQILHVLPLMRWRRLRRTSPNANEPKRRRSWKWINVHK